MFNDGRADFAANPFNGPLPGLAGSCASPASTRAPGPPSRSPFMTMPYSWTSSIGFQRQMGSTMALTSDFNFNGARHERLTLNNLNLTYNPATGLNYPFTDVSRRPIPGWALTQVSVNTGPLQLPRPRDGVQQADEQSLPVLGHLHARRAVGRRSAAVRRRLQDGRPRSRGARWDRCRSRSRADLGGEYGLATSDQRHRAVFNGILELPKGFLVSGLYALRVRRRFAPTSGGDRRGIGVGDGQPPPRGRLARAAQQLRRQRDSSRGPAGVEDVPAR